MIDIEINKDRHKFSQEFEFPEKHMPRNAIAGNKFSALAFKFERRGELPERFILVFNGEHKSLHELSEQELSNYVYDIKLVMKALKNIFKTNVVNVKFSGINWNVLHAHLTMPDLARRSVNLSKEKLAEKILVEIEKARLESDYFLNFDLPNKVKAKKKALNPHIRYEDSWEGFVPCLYTEESVIGLKKEGLQMKAKVLPRASNTSLETMSNLDLVNFMRDVSGASRALQSISGVPTIVEIKTTRMFGGKMRLISDLFAYSDSEERCIENAKKITKAAFISGFK